MLVICFFKQKTAYEMRISDWSSDVCSSDLVAKLQPEGFVRKIEADAGERAALAERLDLISLDRLEAKLHAKFVAGGPVVRVAGSFQASAAQSCVVTLEPVPAVLDEPVETRFGPLVEMTIAELGRATGGASGRQS